MDNSELKQLIINRFREVRTIASEFYGFDFSTIKVNIHWDLTGQTAAYFCPKDNEPSCFRINLALAEDNLEDYLADTIPHEYAHFIVWEYLKDKNCVHGSSWQGVMEKCFNLNPTRCHNYDLSKVVEIHIWNCPTCGKEHKLTKKHHNDLILNRKSWGCNSGHKWSKLVQYGE